MWESIKSSVLYNCASHCLYTSSGSRDSVQDMIENILINTKKFISRTVTKMDKSSVSEWVIPGAGLVLIGSLIFCGPGSPESHLGTKSPEFHLGIKTHQPMWQLVIFGYNLDSSKMERVPVSHYVIAFSEQDIQDEANLENLLNPVCMYVTEWKHHTAYSRRIVLIHLPSVYNM